MSTVSELLIVENADVGNRVVSHSGSQVDVSNGLVITPITRRDVNDVIRSPSNKRVSSYTVEPQWLEHLWDHGNLFETWVVRAIED